MGQAMLKPQATARLRRLPCFCILVPPGSFEGSPRIVELVLTQWAELILRWLHVIAGIAWIGSSFYFIHLDLRRRPRPGLPGGVNGDAWEVHGGGFYHMRSTGSRRSSCPTPDLVQVGGPLTWMSGFGMLGFSTTRRRHS